MYKFSPKDRNKQVVYSYFFSQLRFDKILKAIQCKKVFPINFAKITRYRGKEGINSYVIQHTKNNSKIHYRPKVKCKL